ncbi:MAG: VWA domain-containing protein [Acidobacteria bacterium]|nr:MAG: VWA domain-containing protein [Acidobacteriota bacterium]
MTLTSFRLALVVFLLVGLILSPSRMTGQDPATKPRTDGQPRLSDQTYRVSVDLVNIFCSVWDRKTNSFVTTLTKNNFTLYEDDKQQEIQNFSRETNLPLTIALLVDTSQSVAPKLKFEQEAATNFFYSVLQEKDRACLVEFDSGVTLVQDFTNDSNKLAKQIKTLRAAGGTALYDAIYHISDEKLIREMGRKAIVILSDGEDMSSKSTLQQALEMALRAEGIIYAISVNRGGFFGVGSSKEGDKVLKQLAEETGGRVFVPFKVEELEDSFQQISKELRSQYNIGYFSSNKARDGGYRRVEIKVEEKGVGVRFRRGYYAPTS